MSFHVAMALKFEAVYEEGVLRPLEPLTLPEHQHVHVTVEEEKPTQTRKYDECREEMQWLARESVPYAGQWVALQGPRLIAHGVKLADVRAAAKAAGVDNPLFASVPDSDAPFAGW